VAGASGLVGQEILQILCRDKRYGAVHCVGRRALPAALLQAHPSLHTHTVDFAKPESWDMLPAIDEVFIALGTTIAQAGSQQAFRAVDCEAVLAVAKAGLQRGARRIGVVSAMGASAQSRIFYNRVKGEMEQSVSALGYATVVIARPSFLAGNRESLNQAPRLGERWALAGMRLLAPVIPANYQAVNVQDVAQTLVSRVQQAKGGTQVLLSGSLHT